MVMFEKVCQGLAFLEGDEGQEEVAGEREIERGVGFAMAVPVFLPGAGGAFVVIAVFHGPVLASRACRALFFVRGEAGEEESGERRQGPTQCQVRLHLSLDLAHAAPARAHITPGKVCERAAWRTQWQRGDGYIGDRYCGEDYRLLGELEAAGVAFVVRLCDAAVLTVLEELPLMAADRQAKVTRAAWVTLGCQARYRSIRLRVVWVQTEKEVLRLVTNLGPEELSAGEVALLYKERWRIELFFRWLKCILGCRHWLAESPQGVALQIYLALIAALLLQLYTGRAPTKRVLELIQFYLLGVASLDELCAGLERLTPRKKS